MGKGTQFDEIDADTVAALLDVSTRQLNNYINLKGLPTHGKGRTRTFVWREVKAWDFDYQLSLLDRDGNDGSDDPESGLPTSGKKGLAEAALRKAWAEANLKELQLGKLRGQVISIPDAKVRLNRMTANFRAKVLALPPTLASRIQSERDRSSIEALLKEEFEKLCRDISSGKIVDLPPGALDDDPEEPEALEEDSGPEDEAPDPDAAL